MGRCGRKGLTKGNSLRFNVCVLLILDPLSLVSSLVKMIMIVRHHHHCRCAPSLLLFTNISPPLLGIEHWYPSKEIYYHMIVHNFQYVKQLSHWYKLSELGFSDYHNTTQLFNKSTRRFLVNSHSICLHIIQIQSDRKALRVGDDFARKFKNGSYSYDAANRYHSLEWLQFELLQQVRSSILNGRAFRVCMIVVVCRGCRTLAKIIPVCQYILFLQGFLAKRETMNI